MPIEVWGRDVSPEAAVRWRTWLVVLAVACVGLVAPNLAPFDPRLASGGPLQAPSAVHLLGTNDIGQDVLSQWLWAARATLAIAVGVTVLASGLAWSAGLLAGLSVRAEGPIMLLTDLLLALPGLPIAMLVLTLVGPSQSHVVLLLGLLAWPAFARIVRAQVITVRSAAYIEAARGLGPVIGVDQLEHAGVDQGCGVDPEDLNEGSTSFIPRPLLCG